MLGFVFLDLGDEEVVMEFDVVGAGSGDGCVRNATWLSMSIGRVLA